MQAVVEGFFHPGTSTVSYAVREPDGPACAIIDPVLDFEPSTARTATHSAQAIVDHVRAGGLRVEWILETHVHADHLSAAQWLSTQIGGRIAIGEDVRGVQARFARLFELGTEFSSDGSQFDRLFADGAPLPLGALTGRVIATPGHTPACVSYLFGDAAFVGDTLFMPDYGTARADFPGGDARRLYRSIRRLLDLPPETRLFMCHDYQPGGREPRWETTVRAQRADNPMVKDGVSEDEFVARRTARDAELDAPALILPSLQVNLRAGRLPEPAANGVRYLQIPLDQLGRSR